jgi:hypothetical protein
MLFAKIIKYIYCGSNSQIYHINIAASNSEHQQRNHGRKNRVYSYGEAVLSETII